MRVRLICGEEDLGTAQKARYISRKQAPRTRKAHVIDGLICVVRCGPDTYVKGVPDTKDILVIQITPAFWCVPVRRAELRRGIVAKAPTPPVPDAFSAEARALVKNFEPLAAARLAGYTLAPRFSDEQNGNVTRLTAAYDSMKHPGDTSWHSADGKTVLSWWSGGRYATSSQVWYGVESEDWAHPVTWDAVNAASDPAAVLTPALDGTLPYAYDDWYGYAGSSYAGGRNVPLQARYGVWRNGKLLKKNMPGIAHCERTFRIDGKDVTHHWSVFAYLNTQNGGVALTLTLRQKLGGAEVQLHLPDGLVTTLGAITYSGLLVGEEGPDLTPYTCYAIFSPDATKLLVYGVHDAMSTEMRRTASGFTLTLPTTPLTAGMDPLVMVREVQSSSSCVTTTTVIGTSLVPTTTQYTLNFIRFAPVSVRGSWADGTSGGIYPEGSGITNEAAYFGETRLEVECERRSVMTKYIDTPATRTVRTRVDSVLVPTVDWSQEGTLRYIRANNTYTNKKDWGKAQWSETGDRRYAVITPNMHFGVTPGSMELECNITFYDTTGRTYAAACAVVGSNTFTRTVTTKVYDTGLRGYHLTINEPTVMPYQVFLNRSTQLSLFATLGFTSTMDFGFQSGAYFVVSGQNVYKNPGYMDGVVHYISTAADPYALLVTTLDTWGIPIEYGGIFPNGYTYFRCVSETTAANHMFLRITDEKHAEASLAFDVRQCDFEVINAPTTPYYVADQKTNVSIDLNRTTNVLTDNSPGNTFSITCTPVNSVVALGDTRWPVSVLATVKPLIVTGNNRSYSVGQITTGVRTEITFTGTSASTYLNGVTDGALDMTPAKYSYTTPTGADATDYGNIVFYVTSLATIPPIGGVDWSHDGAAPPCHGLEHWFKYDISPGPRADQIMFGLEYENLSHPPVWGKRPAAWTREKKYAAAVQGVYGDEVFYNSPVFTAIYKPEKL